jgi:hypothetical protein
MELPQGVSPVFRYCSSTQSISGENDDGQGQREHRQPPVRAELADEILKLRRKEKISSIEALDQLPGVGPATLAQLRSLIDFSDRTGNGEGGAKQAQEDERHTQETAAGAEAASDAARSGLLTIYRATGATGVVTLQSADGAAELGRALTNLVQEQTRHNFETWTAFASAVDWDQVAKAVDWGRVVQIQTEYLRTSLERAAELSQRYLEAAQAVMATAADATRDQAEAA